MTRADFYVGRGKNAEYLGSIPSDGYPEPPGIASTPEGVAILNATTEEVFRAAVLLLLSKRKDASLRDRDGWPWPWTTSSGTDFAYAFDDGQVWASCFGHGWWRATTGPEPESSGEGEKVAVFPDMAPIQRVTFGKRSGAIVMVGGRIANDVD